MTFLGCVAEAARSPVLCPVLLCKGSLSQVSARSTPASLTRQPACSRVQSAGHHTPLHAAQLVQQGLTAGAG